MRASSCALFAFQVKAVLLKGDSRRDDAPRAMNSMGCFV